MRIFLLFSLLLFTIPLFAQKTQLTLFSGYGTENNIGNTAFFGGIGIQKGINRKWFLAADITRFTTAIYNNYDKSFENEERLYKAWFITPKVGYALIGDSRSFFAVSLLAGPSLKLYQLKRLFTASIMQNPDGTRTADPSSIKWDEEKRSNISLFGGLNFSFKISSKIDISLILDTYSHEIPIEHLLPGFKLHYKL